MLCVVEFDGYGLFYWLVVDVGGSGIMMLGDSEILLIMVMLVMKWWVLLK